MFSCTQRRQCQRIITTVFANIRLDFIHQSLSTAAAAGLRRTKENTGGIVCRKMSVRTRGGLVDESTGVITGRSLH